MRDGWIAAKRLAALLFVRLVRGGDGERTGVLKKSVVRDRAAVGVEFGSFAMFGAVSAENGDAKKACVLAPVEGWVSESKELEDVLAEQVRTEFADDDWAGSGHGDENGERCSGRGLRCWTAMPASQRVQTLAKSFCSSFTYALLGHHRSTPSPQPLSIF
jgi:hypothetical protein